MSQKLGRNPFGPRVAPAPAEPSKPARKRTASKRRSNDASTRSAKPRWLSRIPTVDRIAFFSLNRAAKTLTLLDLDVQPGTDRKAHSLEICLYRGRRFRLALLSLHAGPANRG